MMCNAHASTCIAAALPILKPYFSLELPYILHRRPPHALTVSDVPGTLS